MSGKLYVVATPIGNLEDLTLRALRVLKEARLIAAEDTRHTGLLLKHFAITTPQVSYHKFNEAQRLGEFTQRLADGENIALVSDAGMPGVSDPGERLIRECLARGIAVEVIPGPSAVLHALVASGLKITPFYFGGFLPVKGGARRKELAAAGARASTSIYFESPYRIMRTLEDCAAVLPDSLVCVARELTKKFEEVKRGKPAEVLQYFRGEGQARGEITFLVQGGNEGH
ncbi:MAG: 16S rRNA (cytidine(1402)-2'-O)-methyltransferase [Verrucomicrobiales bacterium]|jgi:16S rRNA (cytidine1402-2'-O)-methyltransferase|nr:16S rRNA (cytidine(1402)-2'-O)-methyltransferase [Verrucomicrobiales bacterium]